MRRARATQAAAKEANKKTMHEAVAKEATEKEKASRIAQEKCVYHI